MNETERVINDLNVVKITLCNPQMLLTPEMRVRIGQVITSAIDLLKEQEPMEPKWVSGIAGGADAVCGLCWAWLSDHSWAYCPRCGRRVKWDD